jgi:hypothetical protein
MIKHFYRIKYFLVCVTIVAITFFSNLHAQTNQWLRASDYKFSSYTGTYTDIGGTVVNFGGYTDDGQQSITLPFTFKFCTKGANDDSPLAGIQGYTSLYVSANGMVTLGSTISGTLALSPYDNILASTTAVYPPILAPLWDDLDVGTGSVSYNTFGTAPDRIFAVQWKNVKWSRSGTSSQNFQLLLYESSNIIEFKYGTMAAPTSGSASIGISNMITSASRTYQSVTPAATPIVSSSTEKTNISAITNLTSGLVYRFTPPTSRISHDASNQSYPPISAYNRYLRIADLFVSNEVGRGTITTVDWYAKSATNVAIPCKIYMKSTTSSTLSADTWANMISGATTVFDGTINFGSSSLLEGWRTLTLTTPFSYSGDNLLILYESNYATGTAAVSNFSYDDGTSMHQIWFSDIAGTPPSGNGTVNHFRTTVRLSLTGNTSALPVELNSFSALCKDQEIKLDWSTSSETNNDFFTIEKSLDLINYTMVGKVEGAGNSNNSLAYEYTDESSSSEIVYYRLKQTDYDGKFEYFGPVAVVCNNQNDDLINVYPNPANDFLIVSNLPDNTEKVELTDLLGNLLLSDSVVVENKIEFKSLNLAKGLYLLKIESDFKTYIRKVLIN